MFQPLQEMPRPKCGPEADGPGWVYFIEAERVGLIKIGYSMEPEFRLEDMQPHSPCKLKVILTIRGSLPLERKIHERFKHLRRHHEWFLMGDDLMDFIYYWSEVTKETNWKPYELRS